MTEITDNNIQERILRRPEVEAIVGLKRSTLYAAIARGDFPAPMPLTPRTVGWRLSDVNAWLTGQRVWKGADAELRNT